MLRRLYITVLGVLLTYVASAEVLVGATDTARYMSLLEGRRVALLVNHTAMYSAEEHVVDMLHREGVNIVGIFAPEHGFRGAVEAGYDVKDDVDAKTGIPILSLYNGNTKRPTDAVMQSFDVLIVDMQDVGLRFYTYYISMLRMIDACADFGREVIVLDRPNPNGHYVDGPILDMRYKSGVGHIPVPVVHGLTMGEIAMMSIGEGWAKRATVTVVRCRNYDHNTHYTLPIAPSPNLATQHSIYLYPSLCLFEGTVVSVGRGTEAPFEVYGHPAMRGREYSFVPESVAAASKPPYMGERCYGVDLRDMAEEEIWREGFNLEYVIDAYRDLAMGEKFFKPMFEKLVGVAWVREMIIEGRSAEEIEACWSEDVEQYKVLRRRYLLYEE
ncbi:MAG: DUF1343 domain-containing protein [Alistipes sp.]|nr:DUF1343 domain-containing protein [Alistipes sp.]MBO7242345.1 DUF1343 domain-containing protein [Alistipes sp.]